MRIADRAAGALASRTSRRGFLARTAVVGSAVAVAPSFLVKPTSAYAAVCNCRGSPCDCGALCCDGYTEFCCAIYGRNSCPPGSALGGWWKADGTGFCNGTARYYLDCNVVPGQEGICSCGCAGGNCNHRAACCTHFRYGQCHQEIPVMGAIVCRVVTCTPPWQLDASCTQDVLVDQFTAGHDAPCLHPPPIGALDVVALAPRGIRVAGWTIDPETANPIDVHIYVNGVGAAVLRADRPRTDVGAVFRGYGDAHGFDVVVPYTTPGAAQVCVYAINVGEPAGNTSLGCRTVNVGGPFGFLDVVEPRLAALRIAGWAIDPDTADPATVHLYVGNVGVDVVTANQFRSDLAQVYPGYGPNHGFDVVVPWVIPGQHQVCAYAVNTGAPAPNATIGCRAVTT